MKNIKYITLDTISSTNDYLSEYVIDDDSDIVVASAEYQTKGRGQGGNSWESQRGKNLLFSILCRPVDIPASSQFILLQAESLAIKDTLDQYASGFSIKWPNDIYYQDKKISGTLIECILKGSTIDRCVLGTGLNINQHQFVSDAPNPIALCSVIGHDIERDKILHDLSERFAAYLSAIEQGKWDMISERYHQALYRREGYHLYRDSKELFKAEIVKITPYGHLVLRTDAGSLRTYAFKEVTFIIK